MNPHERARTNIRNWIVGPPKQEHKFDGAVEAHSELINYTHQTEHLEDVVKHLLIPIASIFAEEDDLDEASKLMLRSAIAEVSRVIEREDNE